MVLCEGVYNSGNAELTWYDTAKNEAENGVFLKINGGQLGDILHSALKINDELWLIANNSGKIIITDAKTGKTKQRITGLSSPRFAALANGKVYVTNLSFDTTATRLTSSQITVINPTTRQTIKTIPTTWCEQIVQTPDGNLWTGAIRFDKKNQNTHIYSINTTTDAITDSISVGRNPYYMVCDKNGKLWVACKDYNIAQTGQTPKLYQIDPQTKQILQTIDLPNISPFGSTGAQFLTLDAAKENLFYEYQKQIFRKNCTDNTTVSIVNGSSLQFPYGLGINPKNGDIWLADANTQFNTRGNTSVYTQNGVFIRKITTDIGPNGFLFY
jgi:streptogramin lyase